jgi:acetyltransferase-like isoleucine patch superfamily enzyme
VTDFEVELKGAIERLRADTRERWDRDLPVDELLSDRWARAKRLGFGEGSSIYALSYVYGTVHVGENVWIGPYTLLDGTGGLSIGDWCSISAGVQIYSHDSVARAVSGGRAQAAREAVSIGERTYIGSQSVIAKGVDIGAGSVIGASSFVNRSIPAGSFAVGRPCRIIGRVEVGADGTVALVKEGDGAVHGDE